MFKSKLEVMIVVLLLFAIPPLSLVAANSVHTTKVEVVNAAKQ